MAKTRTPLSSLLVRMTSVSFGLSGVPPAGLQLAVAPSWGLTDRSTD